MTPGAVPAWGLLAAGATVQAMVELAAAEPLGFRIVAIGLIVAVLVANAVRSRHRRGQAAAVALLLLVAVPLWFAHAVTVLEGYGLPSMASAALGPCMLIFGTTIQQLLSADS